MAIATAADVVTEIRAHYKGIDATTAQNYLDITINELCRDFPIIIDRFSIALTADTSEYTIGSGAPFHAYQGTATATSASLVRIESAYYKKDALSGHELKPVTIQELDERNPSWRYETSSTPRNIYVTQNSTGDMKIGLYPAPDTTSDPADGSGFPRIDVVFREKFSSSFTSTQPIPNAITNPMILVYGAIVKICIRENDAKTKDYLPFHQREYGKLYDEMARRHRSSKVPVAGGMKSPRLV